MSSLLEKLANKDRKVMSVSIKVDSEVHGRLKAIVEEHNSSLQFVMATLLEAGLEQYDKEKAQSAKKGTNQK